MRRALIACVAVTVSSAPLGVFLVLRRMSMVGDAASHAILLGVAIAFLCFGVSIWYMTIGGLIAGLIIAGLAGFITRITNIKEDASFTASYLISLALGVMIISSKGGAIDLLHILFGNVLAVGGDNLFLICSIATFSLLLLATIYRPLIMECFDSSFLKFQRGGGALYHQLFLGLVVLNLVAAYQALGTMMAVGMMIIPAISTRFWTRNIDIALPLSAGIGGVSSLVGLLLSFHFSVPSGSAIVISASVIYIFSVVFGTADGVLIRYFPRKHFHY